MKYLDYAVTFSEFPNEIALCINITNCPHRCKGCHSQELWENIGIDLTTDKLSQLINSNKGITCVGLMGGDSDPDYINKLAKYISLNYDNIKVGWYTGEESIPKCIDLKNFDYIKTGPYIEEKGGLDNPNTNQRMYMYNKYFSDFTIDKNWRDITYKFWKNEQSPSDS